MKEIQMRVSACQLNVKWAAVEENLRHLQEWLRKHACETDIVVLPEMFATGFCVENITKYANESEKILSKIEEWCRVFSIAIAGSLMCAEKGEYFNRGFFVNESGERYFYDKRHLFRMGGEADVLSFGNSRTIVTYKGWKILLQICYDLRFPVFSRNRNNEYDLAI